MNDRDTYELAEYIVHNQDVLIRYITPEMTAKEIKVMLIHKAIEHFKHLDIDYIYSCFEDERVMLVMDFYYINKGGTYGIKGEH